MADDNGPIGDGSQSGSGGGASGNGRTQAGGGTPIGGLETGKPISVNPADIGAGNTASGGNDNPTGRRKYTRKAKPTAAPGAFNETQALDVNGCKAILLSIHTMLAAFTGAPEWAMDEKEAQAVAEAGVNVSRHYNVATTQKALDWTNFAMTLGAVYGTRLVAASRRKRKTKEDMSAGNAPQHGEMLRVVPGGVGQQPQ